MNARAKVGLALMAALVASTGPLASSAAGASEAKQVVAPTASTDSRTSGVFTSGFQIQRGGDSLQLEYCGNGNIDQASAAVRTVVVVVHGDSRNNCDYASYVVDASRRAGRLSETLVVAPHFLADDDVTSSMRRTLYWSSGGWKTGASSLTSPFKRPWSISSYEALDLLIARTADRARFPNLNRIVVAGHSAGGQFTNRYAAGSALTPAATPGITRRFVVANPSSYLYFDQRRFKGSVLRNLTRSEVAACRGYDDYKYGLQRRSSITAAVDAATLRRRYAASDVTYLLGARDTDPVDDSLDKSCAAKWQGTHRLQRGTNYYSHLGATFGPSVYVRHRQAIVPGVGHSGHAMLASAAGQAALFE